MRRWVEGARGGRGPRNGALLVIRDQSRRRFWRILVDRLPARFSQPVHRSPERVFVDAVLKRKTKICGEGRVAVGISIDFQRCRVLVDQGLADPRRKHGRMRESWKHQ